MLSSEPLKDLSSAPVSRRTVAAGLWAAPVVALTVGVPAASASTMYTASIGPKTDVVADKSKTRRTIAISGTFTGSVSFTVVATQGSGVAFIGWSNGTGGQSVVNGTLTVTLNAGATFVVETQKNASVTVSYGGTTLATG